MMRQKFMVRVRNGARLRTTVCPLLMLLAYGPIGLAEEGSRTPQEFMVPMRDGAHLHTCVGLPEGEGPFPVVLYSTRDV